MSNNILILTNSNFFNVLSNRFLINNFNCLTLNVRYPNEDMSREEHFIYQIQELYNEHYWKKGMVRSKFTFPFNESLLFRIDMAFRKHKPSMVFFEMKSFEDSEWMVLRYISQNYKIPIATFIETGENSNQMMLKLAQNGVREVVTKLDEAIFNNVANRNLKK